MRTMGMVWRYGVSGFDFGGGTVMVWDVWAGFWAGAHGMGLGYGRVPWMDFNCLAKEQETEGVVGWLDERE
ncbi:hypothetical protein MRB53_002788 [Persea americana]|uniref:Uncharacterized protein n=1 Tax=Persea americana TaxID=3435 RepID=A0ACC2MVL2_PERAE|nr:hypothetical protein MRB53_002788 [Persea americana]